MVTQGTLYDLLKDTEKDDVTGAAYLFALKLPRNRIRGTLQIRYRTANGLDRYCEELLRVTGCDSIDWERNTPRLVTPKDERISITNFDVEDLEQPLNEVLLDAYDDIYREQNAEALAEALSSGSVSRSGRIIAILARRRALRTDYRPVDESFLWDAFGLVDDEDFERMARRDIMNELIRVGCIAKNGSDVYVRPALRALPQPEEHLPTVTVDEE